MTQLDVIILISLAALCAVLMILERLGAPVVLSLNFKGDLKRESRFIAQYGQAACTLVAALLVWRLDAGRPMRGVVVFVTPIGTAIAGMVVKRLLGRVRPNHEGAGKFLGPSLKHANWRESFPSNHSASAISLSAVLAAYYAPAAPIFWSLAVACALIRYLMDAHWPSDVAGGIAFGLLSARLIVMAFGTAGQ